MKSRLCNLLLVCALFLAAVGVPAQRAVAQGGDDAGVNATPSPVVQFPGMARTTSDGDTLVPDTAGAAGEMHYLQAVNEKVSLYRKDGRFPGESTVNPPSGNPLFTAGFETFWSSASTGTACDGGNGYHHGQPFVQYDAMSGRFIVGDVATADLNTGPYYICIAVSKGNRPPTPDGGVTYFTSTYWWYYAVNTNQGVYRYLPDLPKLGVWPDGYYLATDLFDVYNGGMNRTPKGVKVWALNRDDLVSGVQEEYRYVSYYLPETMGYEHLVPSHLLGLPPANGTANLFGAIQPGQFHFWKFHVDWMNPQWSTFGTATQEPDFTLATDTTMSWAIGYLAPQPGTVERLDVHGERMVSPLQYRIVDGAATLWATHSLLSGGVTGIRWYEFRPDPLQSGLPVIYQQGTYQPDGHYRWLSSLAVDRVGNMAVGYSISSTSLYPSIRYAGRLYNDPANQLPQGEATLYYGSGFQDDGDALMDGPWGQQSAMSVDPMDECIFWYTNAYYDAGAPATWKTRIGWFTFPECKGGLTSRLSLHTDGTQGDRASGASYWKPAPAGGEATPEGVNLLEGYSAAASADGRYVVFPSDATNLVTAPQDVDSGTYRDIFLRDRDVDVDGLFDEPGAVSTVRIKPASFGLYDEPNGHSSQVSISYDGRYIAFSSEASNLVAGDTNGTRDVFVFDRTTGSIQRISVADVTSLQSNGPCDQPFLSGDGRYVAFRSTATNLVTASQNQGTNVFLRDQSTARTYLISIPISAPQTQNAFTPSVSYDGRYVAFAGLASNFVSGDTNNYEDVFVRDRTTGITTRISVSAGGTQGNNDSYTPYISGNGRFVVFASRATNLIGGDANNYADIYLRDLWTGAVRRISVNFIGVEAQNGNSYTPSISHDGNFITFSSDASNLDVVLPDLNARRDVFLHDQTAVVNGAYENGLTSRISLDYLRGEPNDWSLAPVLAPYGQQVVYISEASDLVPGDTNNTWDVFAFDSRRTIPTFLRIAQNVPAEAGSPVAVPVYFDARSQTIDATAFSIDYDQACLTFNNATFSVPAGFTAGYTHNLADPGGEIDVSIYDATLPYGTLVTGQIMTLNFTVNGGCQVAPGTSSNVRVGFSSSPAPSFGSHGVSILGRGVDGFVSILGGKLGDCNGDTGVNAGDLTGMVLEIFDGDPPDPGSTPWGTFAGNAIGCNPNQDFMVDAGDVSCVVPLIFGSACNGYLPPTARLLSTLTGSPQVNLPTAVATAGQPVTLPVQFTANGQEIVSLAFSVDYDASLVSIDPADADSDGIPDAVALNLPAGFQASVNLDPSDEDGELDVAVWSMSAPQHTLPDGEVISITFTVPDGSVYNDAQIAFGLDPMVSFGSFGGLSIPGTQGSGTIYIIGPISTYLPLVQH